MHYVTPKVYLMSDKQWLRKQATNFLDSKMNHVDKWNLFPDIKNALANRGMIPDDFNRMIRTINEERAEAKQAQQEAEQSTQSNSPIAVETKHREPRRPLNTDIKRKTNPSGGRIASKTSMILDMADERNK